MVRTIGLLRGMLLFILDGAVCGSFWGWMLRMMLVSCLLGMGLYWGFCSVFEEAVVDAVTSQEEYDHGDGYDDAYDLWFHVFGMIIFLVIISRSEVWRIYEKQSWRKENISIKDKGEWI